MILMLNNRIYVQLREASCARSIVFAKDSMSISKFHIYIIIGNRCLDLLLKAFNPTDERVPFVNNLFVQFVHVFQFKRFYCFFQRRTIHAQEYNLSRIRVKTKIVPR
jgi:hypothetical protein